MSKLVNRATAAQHLGIPESTLLEMAKRQEVPAIKTGRVWRFKLEHLDQWLQRRSNGATESEPEFLPMPEMDFEDLINCSSEGRLIGALLAEQRETRRLLVRLSNALKPTQTKPNANQQRP